MHRRTLLKTAALGTAALAAPKAIAAERARTLIYVPSSDLASLDPGYLAPGVSIVHGFMVWDTLYGVDEQFNVKPQMVEGHVIENDGKTWRLTLRPGLKFHDGEPVRARDAVASIKRWAGIDVLGAKLLSVTDELSAPSDQEIVFRLKRPFPLLPWALAKPATYSAFIMPERLVVPAGNKGPIAEIIGSGPYRFLQNERVAGSRVAYARNEAYLPRQEAPNWGTGGRVAYFDRVVWNVIPDAGTAAAALQKGEVDWWELPPVDLVPLLRADPNLRVLVKDIVGGEAGLRMHARVAPFDNPGIRRAVLTSIDQAEYMQAIAGDDRSLWRDKVGVWSIGKPMSTDAGIEVMSGDLAKARQMLTDAGYKGETVAILAPADVPTLYTFAQITADRLQRIGMKVDLQTMDFGTMIQRRNNRGLPDKGGWSMFFVWFDGVNRFNPASNLGITGTYFGWPEVPEIDALREQWFEAPDEASQRDLARKIQLLVWRDVPFIPLGTYYQSTAFHKSLTGISRAGVEFVNVKRG